MIIVYHLYNNTRLYHLWNLPGRRYLITAARVQL